MPTTQISPTPTRSSFFHCSLSFISFSASLNMLELDLLYPEDIFLCLRELFMCLCVSCTLLYLNISMFMKKDYEGCLGT